MKNILKKILSTSCSLFLTAGLVPFSYLKANSADLVGIENIGNTCYYNAAIQQLYSCKSLRIRMINYFHILKTFYGYMPNNKKNIYWLSQLFKIMDEAPDFYYSKRAGKRVRPSVGEKNIRQVLKYFDVNHKQGGAIYVAFSNLFKEINPCQFMNDGSWGGINFVSFDDVLKLFETNGIIDASDIEPLFPYMIEKQQGSFYDNVLIGISFFKNGELKNLNFSESYTVDGREYKLKSLSVYIGRHFFVFVKTNDGWHEINDSTVVAGRGCGFDDMRRKATEDNRRVASLLYGCD